MLPMLPVLSATISIIASGARAMLPKQHIIPTITYGVGSSPIHGNAGSNSRQTAAPTNAPMTVPGGDPVDEDRAQQRAARRDQRQRPRSRWPARRRGVTLEKRGRDPVSLNVF